MKHLGQLALSALAALLLALAPVRAQEESWLEGKWNGIVTARDLSAEMLFVSFTASGGKFAVSYRKPSCTGLWVLGKSDARQAKFKETITSGQGCESGATVLLERRSDSRIDLTYTLPKSKQLFWGALTKDYRVTREELKGGEYPAPRSPELVIAELGLKVVDVDFPASKMQPLSPTEPADRFAGIFHRLPRVVAVREGSPAFFAGVTPGDVVIGFNKGTGPGTGPDRWSMQSSQSLARHVGTYSRTLKKCIVSVFYHRSDSPYVEVGSFSLVLEGRGAQGGWVTEIPTHSTKARTLLPGVEEANARAKAEYAELWKRSMAAVTGRACAVTPAQISEMAEQLNAMAVRAGRSQEMYEIGEGRWYSVERELAEAAEAVCQNSRDGGLSKLESALMAIALRRIDPCEYLPAADYSALFGDPRQARFYTRKGYDEYFLQRLRLTLMTPAQQQCLRRLLRSAFGAG
jgi:hypothetical protein